MQIQQLSSYFERIERTSLRNEITSLLSDLFSRASVKEIDKICYLTMGRLAPPYVGINFNIADKTMMKMIAFAYGVKEDEVKRAFSQKGDLGEVAEFYARKKHTKKTPSPSMKEVYTLLLELATTSGTGSQDVKIQKFASLMKQLDPLSVRFVVRIPVGKLRLGFSDMTILDSLSWMVKKDKSFRKPLEDAYNISSDIGKIATVCKEKGEKGIRTMGVEVGIPIRTAAAERLPSAAAIIKKLGTCAAEPKYDGFRVQIHIDSSKKSEKGDLPLFPGEKPSAWVRLYSRNLENTTQMFPEIVKAAQRLPGKKIVIEGEAIAFNPETEEFLPFQETAQRKRKYGIDQKAKDLPLKVFLFDLLYLDGTSYIDSPYSQRRKKLEALVEHSRQDTLLLATEQIFHDTKALERFFQAMITQGLEGIMVKKLDAPYQAGSRNFNWVKLKREEKGELEDTLDCVVLGYYYGRGKRATFGIGAFLVGIYNKEKDVFQTIAKIGTGLSDEEWKKMKRLCDERKVSQKPARVEVRNELTPHVWVYPERVVLIRADEITRSPVHTAGAERGKAGFALRFPRLMGYREDKSPEDATTLSEIKSLYAHQTQAKVRS